MFRSPGGGDAENKEAPPKSEVSTAFILYSQNMRTQWLSWQGTSKQICTCNVMPLQRPRYYVMHVSRKLIHVFK